LAVARTREKRKSGAGALLLTADGCGRRFAMKQAIGRVYNVLLTLRALIAVALATTPSWILYTSCTVGIVAVALVGLVAFPKPAIPHVKVAMIGNSMMYYNDFPRFMGE
jgi:hypothetical protein